MRREWGDLHNKVCLHRPKNWQAVAETPENTSCTYTHSDKIRACYFNARSLLSKFDELQAIIYEENYDIIGITEMDYTLLHLNCVGKARLGRVLGEAIADIPRPPKIGQGSIVEDDINSVARAEEAASVTDNDHTAPEENEVPEVDREDETGEPSAVPVMDAQTTQEEDFH